jgi:hypothetical protein
MGKADKLSLGQFIITDTVAHELEIRTALAETHGGFVYNDWEVFCDFVGDCGGVSALYE